MYQPRDVECSGCQGISEVWVDSSTPKVFEGECPACGAVAALEKVLVTAPAVSFGGRSGAVQGSGFYATDYGKAGSDLVAGRAIEHTQRLHPSTKIKQKRR